MFYRNIFTIISAATAVQASSKSTAKPHAPILRDALRFETHINSGPSLDMLSTLIIGSEACVLIDLPLAIPQAEALADWVRNTTDKPLVAAFTTHFHPDHYLSGGAFLDQFPDAKYYANSRAVTLIKNEAQLKADYWGAIYGPEVILANVTIPTPYDFSFFTLPNDEDKPIHLVNALGGDTIDETLFWIPSSRTLIAGDAVYSHELHPWVSDLLTPELTKSWLSTLDFLASLKPNVIIPGHAVVNRRFGAAEDLNFTRNYVSYFQTEIESKGPDYFTPEQIFNKLNARFPGLLESSTSATLLNITSENFGKNGTRAIHYFDMTVYNDTSVLDQYKL